MSDPNCLVHNPLLIDRLSIYHLSIYQSIYNLSIYLLNVCIDAKCCRCFPLFWKATPPPSTYQTKNRIKVSWLFFFNSYEGRSFHPAGHFKPLFSLTCFKWASETINLSKTLAGGEGMCSRQSIKRHRLNVYISFIYKT